MAKLNNNDYKFILNYYKLSIPTNKKLLKEKAEKILATKLCKCIKKLGVNKKESRSIKICTESVITKKGLVRGNFSCKKPILNLTKKKSKTRRNN